MDHKDGICSLRGNSVADNELNKKCYHSGCNKLDVFNWVGDLPKNPNATDIVEVRFKNTRKGFYRNVNNLFLRKGDILAVEASPGHDIGIVSLTGDLVIEQIKRNNIDPASTELKKIYRKAKTTDIEKWKEAIAVEIPTMLKARKIADNLSLHMKIGDVEYQGDKTKAIFYYIADERVDFRELIKVLAEEFKVRIEMRQIGARQEAGKIGGDGSCGRELCCSSWITNFISVTTNSARIQELALNPQELAGQCGKLKCCMNYEVDCYIDARKDFPDTNINLETVNGPAYYQKADIHKRLLWYSLGQESAESMVAIPVDRVKEIIRLNKQGIKVEKLADEQAQVKTPVLDYTNTVGEDSLTRFDQQKKRKKKRKR
jgi:cell fate regulator YaaT (PSP1 superfamily)